MDEWLLSGIPSGFPERPLAAPKAAGRDGAFTFQKADGGRGGMRKPYLLSMSTMTLPSTICTGV